MKKKAKENLEAQQEESQKLVNEADRIRAQEEELREKAAVMAYTSIILDEFLLGKISHKNMLGEIYHLCLSWDYLEEIYDFYLLGNAKDDLKYGDCQYYWPDVIAVF